jgi:hypothetical protein
MAGHSSLVSMFIKASRADSTSISRSSGSGCPTALTASDRDAFLSDEAVARQADLRTVVENLLRNSRLIFELYLEHLERIKDLPTFVADLGVYLTDDIALVVDAIALRGRREN